MAKTAISGNDLTLLRGNDHYSDISLFITPRVEIASATITGVPTLSPYIQVSVTWNSGQSNVVVGQLFEIRDSSNNLVSYGVVRKTPTSSIFYINTTPLGSAGYATTIERAIQVGDTITVYNHRPLWSLYSRIGADGNFYKSWDIPYSDQNEEPPPVANCGAWQAAHVNVGETATFTLPKSGSNTSFNFGSATTQSRLWTLPAGVTLVSGYSATDAVIQVNAVAGAHLISYTHTDSNGKVHTAYLWLFVSDGSTGASLSQRYALDDITNDFEDTAGRTMSFTITGEDLDDVLYPGAGFLFREWAYYGASTLTEGVGIDTFIGYITELEFAHDGNIGVAYITVESPFLYAQRLPQPSQVVEEVSNPNKWTQITSALSNPRGFLYYAIKWHTPALLDMHDLDAPYTTPRRQNAQWQKGSLADAMSVSAEYLAGSVGSASDGTTVLRANPLYMNSSDRNSVANLITWQDRDLQPNVSYVKRLSQPLYESRTGAFAFNGTATKAWLARKFWQQGTGSATLANFTVTASEGLPRVLEVVGHFHAEQNRDIIEIPLILTANQDVISPAYWLWCSVTISAEWDTLGNGFTSQRGLVKTVTREWEYKELQGEWHKTITYGFQPETFGQAGEEVPITNYNAYSYIVPSFYLPYQGDGAFGGSSIAIALTSGGELAITYNYQAANPVWADMTTFVGGETVNDFCIDYGSAYYANGLNSGYALGLFVVTTDDTTLNVWYFNDILNSTVAYITASATMADDSNTSNARIEVSETYPQLIVVVWHDQTGIECIRSTDGTLGGNFSSKFNIGDAITDTSNDNAAIGLDVDGQNQLVTAPNSSNEYGAYLATTAAGSFSRLSNSVASSKPYHLVKIAYETDDAIVSRGGSLLSTFTHAFNSGTDLLTTYNETDADYNTLDPDPPAMNVGEDNSTLSPTATIDASAGNPTFCARLNPTSGTVGSGGFFWNINFDLIDGATESNTINNLIFDYWVDDAIDTKVEIVVTIREDTGTAITRTFSSLTADTWTTIDVMNDAVSDPFPVDMGNASFRFEVNIQWKCQTGQTLDASAETVDVRIDNIQFQLDDPLGGAGNLYLVEDFDNTDTWSDISPATGELPTRPHDLAVDLVDTSVLNTWVSSSNKWYSSSNLGSSWTTEETSSDKAAFYTSGTSILGAGTDNVELALDGATFEDKTGNLASVVSSIGTIKRIFAL